MEIHWVFAHTFRKGRRLKVDSLAQWDPPNREEPVTSEQRAAIISKIKEYCEKKAMHLNLV
jgi:hypothetical protein